MAEQATSLDALLKLSQLFQGTKTKESGGGFTETSQTSLTPAMTQALLKSQLESTQGLASTAQGQRAAGLYNSSANRLLVNDLLSRLTARTAEASAAKTTSRTGADRITQVGGSSKQLNNALLGLTAYQKLTGKNPLDQLTKEGKGLLESILGSDAVDTAAFNTAGPANYEQAFSPMVSSIPSVMGSPLDIGFNIMSDFGQSDQAIQTAGYGDIMAADFPGFTEAQIGESPAAGQYYIPTEEEFANFSKAPAASGSAASGASVDYNITGAAGSAASLYSGYQALTDKSSANDAYGATATASGAYGAYKAYENYQKASQAAEASDTALSFSAGTAGSGSTLGYLGAAASALYAPNNPEGAQNKDYRHAIGSAVLNYFGAGFAAPFLHPIAEEVSDTAMDLGSDIGGIAGSFALEPVGTLFSGKYEFGDVASAVADPLNLFGGNDGGVLGVDLNDAIDSAGNILEDAGDFLGDIGGDCFITTAVMKHMSDQFDDKCDELETLRKFRDGYLAELPEGKALIQQYYDEAPKIVRELEAREDSGQIWKLLHRTYISQAVRQIKAGKNAEAFATYTNMVHWLKELIA